MEEGPWRSFAPKCQQLLMTETQGACRLHLRYFLCREECLLQEALPDCPRLCLLHSPLLDFSQHCTYLDPPLALKLEF